MPQYLLVYQQVRRGRDERWMLRSGRVVPLELTDDVEVFAKFGSGYYRVDGRLDGGKLCGASHYLAVPDDKGKVEIPSVGDADASDAPSGGNGDMVMFLKMLLDRSDREMERFRHINDANLAAFSAITERVLGAGGSKSAGDDSTLRFFTEKLGKVEERAQEMFKENVKLQIEAAKREGKKDDSFETEIAKMALPKFLEMMDRPASRRASVADRVREQQRGATRAQTRREVVVEAEPEPSEPAAKSAPEAPAPAPAASTLTAEELTARREALGWEIPPIDVVRERLSEGKGLGAVGQMRYRMLRDLGLLDADYLALVLPHL